MWKRGWVALPHPATDGREKGAKRAFKQKAAEKTQAAPEKSMPVFVVRAKVHGDRWETIGAAWHADINGKPGYSVKLNTIPAGGWDGSFLLMPPLPKDGA